MTKAKKPAGKSNHEMKSSKHAGKHEAKKMPPKRTYLEDDEDLEMDMDEMEDVDIDKSFNSFDRDDDEEDEDY